MRVFLDSNVLISAFASNGVSSKLFDLLNESHEIIVSPQVFSEFRRIAIEKFHADPFEIDDFIVEVRKNSEECFPPYPKTFEIRDPNDIDIVGAAIKSHADVIASGDKDLLEMPNPPVPVRRPRQLYDLLIAGSRS